MSDPHGHPDQLTAALHDAGLVDGGAWSGGDARLFVLGDLLDRGPDGIGVIDLIMTWEGQAAEAGGEVRTLLGNHEALAIGMHEFGPQAPGDSDGRAQAFAHSWMRNGGIAADQERLSGPQLEWLRSLPAIIVDGDLLMLHSDTLEYLLWGESVEAINASVAAALSSPEADDAWSCWQRLTDRYAFLGEAGPAVARELMGALGGSRIVHGHSIIADLRGMAPGDVSAPYRYADDLVLAIDGGLYAGGPLLVVDLD